VFAKWPRGGLGQLARYEIMMQQSAWKGDWMSGSTAVEHTERRAVVHPCKKTISLYSNSPTYLILDLSKYDFCGNFCRPVQTIKQSWNLILHPASYYITREF